MTNLAERFKIIDAMPPAADAAGRTADYVSLKNAHCLTIVVFIQQGNAATVALTVEQATAVAGTGSKAIANNVPIWANLDTTASDAMVKAAAGVAYTTNAAVKPKMVIFQIDPSTLDLAGGFDCVALKTGASNAANVTSAMYFIEGRYGGPGAPSSIID